MGPFRPAGTPRAPLAPAPGAARPSRVPGAGVGRLRGSRAAAGARAAGKTSKMGQIRRIWSPPGCERSCCSTREWDSSAFLYIASAESRSSLFVTRRATEALPK